MVCAGCPFCRAGRGESDSISPPCRTDHIEYGKAARFATVVPAELEGLSYYLMMRSFRASIWPYVCSAACLLVLCVLAPRAWRALEPLRRGLPELRETPTVARPVAAERRQSGEQEAKPNSTSAVLAPRPLSEMLPPPLVADLQPPVAERIESSPAPSIVDEPSPLELTVPQPAPPDSPPAPPVESDSASEQPSARVPKEPQPLPPMAAGCWPSSPVLEHDLHVLSQHEPTRDWATRMREELDALVRINVLASPEFPPLLARMKRIVGEADDLDARLTSLEVRKQLRRAAYDLVKRIELWQQIYKLARLGDPLRRSRHDDAAMTAALEAVDRQLQPLHDSGAWRNFLLLDEMRRLVEKEQSSAAREQLAAVVLTRLDSPQLTRVQERFLATPAFEALRLQLRYWASQPVDYTHLLELLERHELLGDDVDELAVAQTARMLLWSPEQDLVELGELLEAHWRNANIRVAIAGELINRLLPPPPPETQEPVNDRIRGARVFGRSEARTDGLFVRLLPDRTRLRLGVEAQGRVASETAASSGPVRIFNEGLARFRVRKLFTIDRRGVSAAQAEGEADSDTVMTGLQTEYDGYPLVGALVRSIAMQQAEAEAGPAKWEVEQKVAARASRRLDEAVEHKLIAAERDFQQKVLLPLRRLDLDPVPIEMQTTAERLIVRYRLAGDDQLAAYTPRPQAPSNSLFSLQLHQSVVNNSLSKLNLAGRRATLEEIFHDVADATGRPDAKLPEDMPEGITIEFAERNPLMVEFVEGRVLLTMRFTEIRSKGGGRWQNFSVRGEYVPTVDGLEATLSREGIVYLDSLEGHPPLTLGERFALRSIFTKVLSKQQKVQLVPAAVRTHEKLANLHFSQFEIEDGWIGAALVQRPVHVHLESEVRAGGIPRRLPR